MVEVADRVGAIENPLAEKHYMGGEGCCIGAEGVVANLVEKEHWFVVE